MKKIIPLSLLTIASLYAAEIELAPIGVESTIITEVAQNAKTSADVATALSSSVPSIDMSRRSGIANDILIRGQKRDNISVEVDGTKVCGACPNRMDPPVSHILANQIETIEVTEGPYDVENFGTLSGGVKIKTKQPTKEEKVELNLGFGAWNYKKFGATASGGNDFIRMLVTASMESSDQYKDGNGDTLAGQIDKNAIATSPDLKTNAARLQDKYHDMPAYDKKSVMAKAFVTTAENQELRLSVTANRSDNVLYANSSMDALYDDSNIYSVEYNVDALSEAYKNLNIQYYYSDVDHPMATTYRKSSEQATTPIMISHLKTTMQGVKLKNSLEVESYKILLGLDGSKRTWDGQYYMNDTMISDSAMMSSTSIDNATTDNLALFAKVGKSYGALDVSVGARYDATHIENDDLTQQSNDYNAFGANIFTTYHLNKEHKLFFGLGQASRVPDARELYFKQNATMPDGTKRIKTTGTDNLKQTTNQEIDFGYEANAETFKLKIKGFYSLLKDYVYYNKILANNNFVNLDATVYGAELSASYYATNDMSVDLGASYKRGQKDNALAGQTGTNLADMAPLRANVALNYEYANNSLATLGVQASDKWNDVDAENGEQVLDSWAILNMKVKHAVNKKFDFTIGVNNMLDETYAASNTYADLILVTSGTGDVMLLNEPGRYFYTNLDFKF